MPFISGGGGAAFNGGTITQPLTISSPSDSTVAFHVVAGSGATIGVEVTVNPASHSVEVKGLDNDGILKVSNDFDSNYGEVSSGGLFLVGPGDRRTALTQAGLSTQVNVAPSNPAGQLIPGEVVLWFDDTNGASKLMAIGQSANGTVVGAAIALA